MLKSFHFVDNEKVDMFLGLQFKQKLGLKLDIKELNAIFKPQDTYMMVRSTVVLDLGQRVRGFWTKLQVGGSQLPVSRDNA